MDYRFPSRIEESGKARERERERVSFFVSFWLGFAFEHLWVTI